jgi:uncharacterized cupin superfamily protein
MPTLIAQPTRIQAAGNKPKLIDEYIGRINSKTQAASVAHMRSPQGWVEPGQTPEFDEFTIVLKGRLRVEHKQGALEVAAGQAVIVHAGEWVARNTSPCACRRSPWIRCAATGSSGQQLSFHRLPEVQRVRSPISY